MRRTWNTRRSALFAGAGAAAPAELRGARSPELVGRDFARGRAVGHRRLRALALPVLVGALISALLLATLRTSILRMRYELAASLTEETALLERKRAATVALRELRDPARLHRLAAERGLARPERVIELPPRKEGP